MPLADVVRTAVPLFALVLFALFQTARRVVHAWESVPENLHWSERARRLAPLRSELGVWVVLVGMGVPFALGVLSPGVSPLGRALGVALGLLAALTAQTWVEHRVLSAPVSMGLAVRHVLAGWLVRIDALAPWLAWAAMPRSLDAVAFGLAVSTTGLVLAWSFVGPRLARRLGFLTDAPAEVAAVVADVARQRAMPVPATWVFPSHLANAFAVPDHGAVGLSSRTLEVVRDPRELAALLHHELAHLAEPRAIHVLRRLATISFVPLLFAGPLANELGLVGPVLAVGTWLVLASILQRRLFVLEERADAAAGDIDGATYARALERLHEANLAPVVTSASSSHPALYDRLLSLGVEPSYARPEPPPGVGRRTALIACLAAAFALGTSVAPALGRSVPESHEGAAAEP